MKAIKINWKIRLKSCKFWIQILLAVATPVSAYYGLTGADMTTWPKLFSSVLEAISNPYVVATMAVSVFNTIIDPTTAGLCDSRQALTYTEVKKEQKESS